MAGRFLGLDYGDARTGVALSDPTGFLASSAGVINGTHPNAVANEVNEYVKKYGVTRIILGDPKNMNGTSGPRSEKTAIFAGMLREKCGVEVILRDERRTTVDAARILSENGTFGKKRKQTIDAVAAVLILQSYLDSDASKQ